MKNDFINALEKNDIGILSKIEKTDLHNHATYSCTKKYLIDSGICLPPDDSVTDIASLNSFIRTFVNPLQYNIDTLPILLKGNFENCINTGVKVVAPSIDYKSCIRVFDNDVNKFIGFLQNFKYDNLVILWDLGISRDSYVDEHKDLIIQLIKTGFFTGVDLYAVENSKPNKLFAEFYELANNMGMITKVHAGEQLGAHYVLDCINDFNPKQIQHGIRIIEDENVMEIARKKGILFNVCPTSNAVLGYAKSMREHPIKIMYDKGLVISLATDDLLFFNSDINNEYLVLFNNGVLSAQQLNEIRKNGLIQSTFIKETNKEKIK